jgi:putative hydrolase of the HAD superfamily
MQERHNTADNDREPHGLLLDFGGVISITLFERHRTTERLLGLAAGALDWRGPFAPEADTLWRDMLAGRISERDYWAIRARETGCLVGEDWTMLDLIARARGPDPNLHVRPEAVATIARVRAGGIRVGILSNELELFYGREMMDALDVLKDIDAIVDATHTKILKPDPRAYALGLEALGTRAEDTVFVDDQFRNVKGARRAGFQVVAFDVTRPADSFAEAERLLADGSARPDMTGRADRPQ